MEQKETDIEVSAEKSESSLPKQIEDMSKQDLINVIGIIQSKYIKELEKQNDALRQKLEEAEVLIENLKKFIEDSKRVSPPNINVRNDEYVDNYDAMRKSIDKYIKAANNGYKKYIPNNNGTTPIWYGSSHPTDFDALTNKYQERDVKTESSSQRDYTTFIPQDIQGVEYTSSNLKEAIEIFNQALTTKCIKENE